MQSILRQSARNAVQSRSLRSFATPQFSWSIARRTLVTKHYTSDHELVAFDDVTRIGSVYLTDHAQASLGDVVFVELPTIGQTVTQGEQIGAVESVKAASDIYAPVSGAVEEVNEALGSQPGLINKSPEDKAWLCKIKLSNPEEVKELLDAAAYKKHCES